MVLHNSYVFRNNTGNDKGFINRDGKPFSSNSVSLYVHCN